MTLVLKIGALAGKLLIRNRLGSILTISGIAAGMFLYTGVEALRQSLDRTLREAAQTASLTVYQKDRFCPNTSRLQDRYAAEILRNKDLVAKGVTGAWPILVRVNNCGAALDAVTFRGVPDDYVATVAKDLEIAEGTLSGWPTRRDAAIAPVALARERGLKVGDTLEAAGITATIVALTRSETTEAATSVYVPLEFLQQQSVGLGIATLIHVDVRDATVLDAVARGIDELYHSGPIETKTHNQREFFTQAAGQMMEILALAAWLGPISLAAVLFLILNSALLMVRKRAKEAAIYQTLGWHRRHVVLLTVCEGLLLGLGGGLLGGVGCGAWLRTWPLRLSNEGVSTLVTVDGVTLGIALAAAALLGVLATLGPALMAARRPLVEVLR